MAGRRSTRPPDSTCRVTIHRDDRGMAGHGIGHRDPKPDHAGNSAMTPPSSMLPVATVPGSRSRSISRVVHELVDPACRAGPPSTVHTPDPGARWSTLGRTRARRTALRRPRDPFNAPPGAEHPPALTTNTRISSGHHGGCPQPRGDGPDPARAAAYRQHGPVISLSDLNDVPGRRTRHT
jgi:hypothetical protein